jgi:hypothetical protein
MFTTGEVRVFHGNEWCVDYTVFHIARNAILHTLGVDAKLALRGTESWIVRYW